MLGTVLLFKKLSHPELQGLRAIAQNKSFPAGAVIFQEGEFGDGVYFVKNGAVEISAGQGARRVFTRFGRGEIFGEMAIIEQRPRSATATAVAATDTYFFPRNEMIEFIRRSPALAFDLLQEISHRLREFNKLYIREMIQAENLAVVGRFAQGIVHDLKNPLAVISLSMEMFTLPQIKPEIRAKTQVLVRKQVERINDMVSDILIFTRADGKGGEPEHADYAAFVRDLVPELQTDAQPRSVQIECAAPPAVAVQIDPRRLSRVFFNLTHNAMDFMPDGGKIFLHFQANENEIITQVEDTGTGIAPEIADTLFQPFATHGKAHGTGLGLSICKKIVEDHGGKIWAQSEPHRGAIFCFSLPLAK